MEVVLNKVVLIRDLTTIECRWLSRNFAEGEEFYLAIDHYACCTPEQTPCSKSANGIPYFGLPTDALIYSFKSDPLVEEGDNV